MRRARTPREPQGAMTIHDIARVAGVSTATVSRALRGLPGVSPQTREQVLATAERLDYVISPAASRLSSGRAGSVAVVTPYVSRWYFAHVLSGVERVLRSSDLDLLLLCVGEPDEAHPSPPVHKLRRRVDGVLVLALAGDDPRVQDAVRLQVPTVLVGLTTKGVASVRVDDVAGEVTATQHLLNLGHQRIALICGASTTPRFAAEKARAEGYASALAAAGVTADPSLVVPGDFTAAGGEQAMTDLLSRRDPPTAVVAMSDEMAFGAIRALHRHGLRPGTDVSVVGYDDHELACAFDLTTVAQPVEQLGSTAALALLDLCSGTSREGDTVLPTRLVARGSTGPVACRPAAVANS